MYSHIVSFLTWYYDDIESDFCEVWIYYTTIVCIVWLPFLTHIEIICRANWCNKLIRAVSWTTRIISISYIFSIFWSIDDFRVDSTSTKPSIDHRKVIVAISWISSMMIFSFSCCKYLVPVRCCRIKTSIIIIFSERKSTSCRIVPVEPCRSYTIHIDSWDIWWDGIVRRRKRRLGCWTLGGILSCCCFLRFCSSLGSNFCKSELILNLFFESIVYLVYGRLSIHLSCETRTKYDRLSKDALDKTKKYKKWWKYFFHTGILSQYWFFAISWTKLLHIYNFIEKRFAFLLR